MDDGPAWRGSDGGVAGPNTLTAAVPAALLNATFQAALTFAAANAIAGGAASAQALTLSRGVLRDMLLRKLKTVCKTVAPAVLAVAVVTGAGGLATTAWRSSRPPRMASRLTSPKRDREAILARGRS